MHVLNETRIHPPPSFNFKSLRDFQTLNEAGIHVFFFPRARGSCCYTCLSVHLIAGLGAHHGEVIFCCFGYDYYLSMSGKPFVRTPGHQACHELLVTGGVGPTRIGSNQGGLSTGQTAQIRHTVHPVYLSLVCCGLVGR